MLTSDLSGSSAIQPLAASEEIGTIHLSSIIQTHMMIVRPNEMGMKTYKIDSNEIETCNKVINVDNKTENVQTKTCYRKLYRIYGRPCVQSHILLFKADSNLQQRK